MERTGRQRRSRSALMIASSLLVMVAAGCDRPAPPAEAAPEPNEEVVRPNASPLAAVSLPAEAPASEEPSACADGMVLVEGMYCPEVRQTCKRWMDPPGRYHEFRCAEYGEPRCLAPKKKMRFCIDRDEYSAPGENLPANFQSFNSASRICKEQGKRICMESEWVFACEGEEMRPYPYGFKRDASACNADRTDILTDDGKLRDLRAAPDEHPRCESPFGVRHQAGNLEEFVAIDGSTPVRPAMKGAYWQPSRNFCRAAQTAHDAHYNGMETGFRCCAEAE